MSAKKGLGRGFESLIPSDLLDESFDPTAGDDNAVSELRNIKLDQIEGDPEQPRKHFDEAHLKELSNSIAAHGVLQPIVVTAKNGKYVIVAGERRFLASQMAGLKSIPALVRTLTDQHRLELALIENLQRRDLNPLETATAYGKLRDQFNMTLEQIGQTVGGRSISSISNTIRLLRLPKEVQVHVAEGRLSEGQARPLVDADPELVKSLLPQIVAGNWSARRVENAMRTAKAAAKPEEKKESTFTKRYDEVALSMTKRLSADVKVTSKRSGSGQIVISFRDQKEFDRLRDQFLN